MKDAVTLLLANDLQVGEDYDAICSQARSAIERWVQCETDVSMHGRRGAPDWHEHESKTWRLGESFRRLAMKDAHLANNPAFLSLLNWVVATDEVGLGRQPFIELALLYDRNRNTDIVGRLIEVPGLTGHAVKALRAAHVDGFAEAVQRVLATRQPKWVRNEARKYLKECQ